MTLSFRNVDADPSEPVSAWPTEAVQAALERGGLRHWRRLAAAVRADPWGPVARRIEAVLEHSRPYGAGTLMHEVLSDARSRRESEESATVAARVRSLVERSGLTQREFA